MGRSDRGHRTVGTAGHPDFVTGELLGPCLARYLRRGRHAAAADLPVPDRQKKGRGMKILSEGELFRKILGPKWAQLHPDIQLRFGRNPLPGKPLHYVGYLTELSCSPFGRMLGYLTMPLIKGAL